MLCPAAVTQIAKRGNRYIFGTGQDHHYLHSRCNKIADTRCTNCRRYHNIHDRSIFVRDRIRRSKSAYLEENTGKADVG